MKRASTGSVFRTLLVCGTIAFIAYLGYAVVESRPGPITEFDATAETAETSTEATIGIREIAEQMARMEQQQTELVLAMESVADTLAALRESQQSAPSGRPLGVKQSTAGGNDILNSLASYGRSSVTDEGVELNIGCLMLSPWRYEVPFTITAEVLASSQDIRIHATGGHVIFNWAVSPDELRVHDPATHEVTSVAGEGRLPRDDKWATVSWTLADDHMVIKVAGREVFRKSGDYAGSSMQVGVGTYAAKATIKSFAISSPQSQQNIFDFDETTPDS